MWSVDVLEVQEMNDILTLISIFSYMHWPFFDFFQALNMCKYFLQKCKHRGFVYLFIMLIESSPANRFRSFKESAALKGLGVFGHRLSLLPASFVMVNLPGIALNGANMPVRQSLKKSNWMIGCLLCQEASNAARCMAARRWKQEQNGREWNGM